MIPDLIVIVACVAAIYAYKRAERAEKFAQKLASKLSQLQRDIDHLIAELQSLKSAALPDRAIEQPLTVLKVKAVTRRVKQEVISEATAFKDAEASPVQATNEVSETVTVPPEAQTPVTEPPTSSKPPERDLEELLGTRWAVWVGAAALALGALFLVRYSIESGVFGPRVRLTMASLFSLGLMGLGEALRRGSFRIGRDLGPLPAGQVPLALTAAGTFGLLGTVYAAHAVYGFIGQTPAFLLMGSIGIGAMMAATLHGQALAGIGLVASYATPVLIGGESTSRWPLVLFLLTVTGAAIFLQHRMRTLWLGWATLAGAAIWSALMIVAHRANVSAELVFLLGAMILFALALVWLPLSEASVAKRDTPVGDALPLVALFGPAMAMGALFLSQDIPPTSFVIAALLAIFLLLATSLRSSRASLAAVAAVLLPLGMILCWPGIAGNRSWFGRVLHGALLNLTTSPISNHLLTLLTLGAASVLFSAPLMLALKFIKPNPDHKLEGSIAIAFSGALAAPVLVLANAIRRNSIEQDAPTAMIMLAITLVAAFASDWAYRKRDQNSANDVMLVVSSGYASAAALAFGLAIAFGLRDLWMAIGFAAAALGVAGLNHHRPMPALRRTTAVMATTAVLRGVLSPPVHSLDALPFLNNYLLAYAFPAFMLAGTTLLLLKEAKDRSLRTVEFAMFALAAVWALFTIRHGFLTGTSLPLSATGLLLSPIKFHEVWVFAAAGLGFVFAGYRLSRRDMGKPAELATQGGLLVMLIAIPIYLLVLNPLLSVRADTLTGYVILNRLTVGYGFTILSLIAAAFILHRFPMKTFSGVALAAGALLTLIWLLMQIRLAFNGLDLWNNGNLGLGESGIYVLLFLMMTIMINWLHKTNVPSFLLAHAPNAVMATNALALGLLIVLCLGVANPWLGQRLFGPIILDSSLVGYLMPALALGWLAKEGRGDPEFFDSRLAQINHYAAIGLGWFYLLTNVRRLHTGVDGFTWQAISNSEQYAYSLTTLIYGVIVLAIGFKLQSRPTRIASAFFVILAVAKVFLLDMSELTGLWRAISFIGLGVVLIGIGLAYQRILYDGRKNAANPLA